MKKDLISIIIPTLNSSSTIASTLKSVLKQTFINWEVIIIDGYSTDKTISIIKKFKNSKFKIFFLSKNKGLAEARYYGIKKSKGKYIAFLDSDDLWKKDKLKEQINFMKRNNVFFSATKYLIQSKKSNYMDLNYSLKVDYDYLLFNRPICNSSVLIKKDLILKVAKRNRHNIYAEDYLWWLEVLKKESYCFIINKNLTTLKLSTDNRSKNFIKNFTDLFFIYRKINKLNLTKIIIIYMILIKNNFKKNLFKFRGIYLNS